MAIGTSIGRLFVEFGAEFTDLAKDVTKLQSTFEGLESKLTKTGTALSLAITAPLAGIGTVALKTFGDFESALNKISAVQGIFGQDLEKLRAQAMKLGADTQFSARQAADAMGEFAASGFNATQIYQAMPGALGLAAAGQLKVADAAQISAGILKGFGLETSRITEVADVLAKAAAESAVSVGDLGFSFKYVGPVASAAGVSLQETAAALAILGNAGIKGEMGGTAIRNMLSDLLKPSKAAAEAMAELGIKVTDANGKLLPMGQIIEKLAPLQNNLTAGFQIFGVRFSEVLPLLKAGKQGFDELSTKMNDASKGAGAAADMAKIIFKGWNASVEQFKGSVETAFIAIGSVLAKPLGQLLDNVLTPFMNWIVKAAEAFGKLPQPIQTATVAFMGLAAVVGPALLTFGKLVGLFADLKLLPGLLNTIGTGLTGTGNTIATFGKTASEGIKALIGQLTAANITKAANDFKSSLLSIASTAADVFKALPGNMEKGLTAVSAALMKGVNEIPSQISSVLSAGSGKITEATAGMFSKAQTGVAKSWEGISSVVTGALSGLATKISSFSWAGLTAGLGSIASQLGALAAAGGPIAIVVAALATIGAVAYQVYDNWGDIKSTFKALLLDLGDAAKGISEKFMNAFGTPFVKMIESAWSSFKGFMGGVLEAVGNKFKELEGWAIKVLGEPVVGAIKASWNAIAGFFTGIWNGIKSVVGSIGTFIMDSLGPKVTGALSSLWAGWSKAMVTQFNQLLHPVKTIVDGLKAAADMAGLKNTSKALEDWQKHLQGVATEATNASKAVGGAAQAQQAAATATNTAAAAQRTAGEAAAYAAGQQQAAAAAAANAAKEHDKSARAIAAAAAAAKKAHDEAAASTAALNKLISGVWGTIGESVTKAAQALVSGDFQSALETLKSRLKELEGAFGQSIPEAIRKGMVVHLVLGINKAQEFADKMSAASASIEADFLRLQETLAELPNDISGIATGVESFLTTMGQDVGTLAQGISDDFEDIGESSEELESNLSSDQTSIRGSLDRTREKASELEKALGGVFRNFRDDIADSILKAEGFGDAFRKAADSIKEVLMRQLVDGALKALTGGLTGITKQLGGLSGLFNNILGLSKETTQSVTTAVTATTGATGGLGNLGSQIGGTVAKSITGALTGFVQPISAAVSAITGVIGLFGQRRIEQDVGRIEVTTREIFSQLLSIQNDVNKYWPSLMNLSELQRLSFLEGVIVEAKQQLEILVGLARDMVTSLSGGGGGGQTVSVDSEALAALSAIRDSVDRVTESSANAVEVLLNIQDILSSIAVNGFNLEMPALRQIYGTITETDAALEELEGTLTEVTTSTDEATESTESLGTAATEATEPLNATVKTLGEVPATTLEATQALSGAGDAFKGAAKETDKVTDAVKTQTGALTATGNAAEVVGNAFTDLSKTQSSTTRVTDEFASSIANLENPMSAVAEGVNGTVTLLEASAEHYENKMADIGKKMSANANIMDQTQAAMQAMGINLAGSSEQARNEYYRIYMDMMGFSDKLKEGADRIDPAADLIANGFFHVGDAVTQGATYVANSSDTAAGVVGAAMAQSGNIFQEAITQGAGVLGNGIVGLGNAVVGAANAAMSQIAGAAAAIPGGAGGPTFTPAGYTSFTPSSGGGTAGAASGGTSINLGGGSITGGTGGSKPAGTPITPATSLPAPTGPKAEPGEISMQEFQAKGYTAGRMGAGGGIIPYGPNGQPLSMTPPVTPQGGQPLVPPIPTTTIPVDTGGGDSSAPGSLVALQKAIQELTQRIAMGQAAGADAAKMDDWRKQLQAMQDEAVRLRQQQQPIAPPVVPDLRPPNSTVPAPAYQSAPTTEAMPPLNITVSVNNADADKIAQTIVDRVRRMTGR